MPSPPVFSQAASTEIAAISHDKHTDASNPASRMAATFPGKVVACLSLLLIGSAWTSAAHALCKPKPGAPSYQDVLPITALPSVTTLKRVGVGGVMAEYTVPLNLTNSRTPSWDGCGSNGLYGLTPPITTLRSSHMDRVHETGIPGVGIRIKAVSDLNDRIFYTEAIPFTRPTPQSPSLKPPIKLYFEFIRTAMGVGKGDITFNYETQFFIQTTDKPNGSYHTITGTSLRTTLKQDVYFTSCHTPSPLPPVELGRTMIAEIKLGRTKEHAFSLDVQCEGMNPATKPPVKVYFEGNGRDGLLNLDGGGASKVAKGVGIAVTDDKGKDVPFTKEGALPLTWQSSGNNLERYRFSGKARYAATSGEITAGKADATLSYVLQYE